MAKYRAIAVYEDGDLFYVAERAFNGGWERTGCECFDVNECEDMLKSAARHGEYADEKRQEAKAFEPITMDFPDN